MRQVIMRGVVEAYRHPPAIRRLQVNNFKSFKELRVDDMPRFGVLIGANASGKSNFVQIFEFLRDLAQQGLENAISLQGGIEYLRNIHLGAREPLRIQVVLGTNLVPIIVRAAREYIRIPVMSYEFRLEFARRGMRYKTVHEAIEYSYQILRATSDEPNPEADEHVQSGSVLIRQTNGRVEYNIGSLPEEFHGLFWFRRGLKPRMPRGELLIQIPFLPVLRWFYGDVGIYDFDPKLPKRAMPITGKSELERDGSNLAIVLNRIAENPAHKERLLKFVRSVLPFVEDIRAERFADKSVIFSLREMYHKKRFLPASMISDGTVGVLAMIIALYLESNSLVIFEEPERNIHPSLLAHVVAMMKDASEHKQVLVTTHNPEFVKHAGVEHLLLISRDPEGFSVITRPAEREDVRIFLENEIGIEDIYVQNLLGA